MRFIKQLLLILFLFSIATQAFSAKNQTCEIPPSMKELAKDLASNAALESEFKKSSPDRIKGLGEAWVLLNSSSKKRTAPELLAGIATHFKDSPFSNNKKLRDDYIKAVLAYTGRISTNPNGGYKNLPKNAEDYFNALFEYTKKYNSQPGFELPDYKNQKFSQDSFYLTLRYMNSNKVSSSEVKNLDMKFENSEGGCPNCRFDVTLNDDTLIEFKSYKDPVEFHHVVASTFKN